MMISPGGKTVHFEADSKPLFDSEKNGTQPVFVAILEHSQRKRITSKIEHILIRYFHEDMFIRDITGIYDVGRIEAYYVVSFTWLPLAPHDHRDSMHEPGHEHRGDDSFMKDAMNHAKENYDWSEWVMKKTPHTSYFDDALTGWSLRPPRSNDREITRPVNVPVLSTVHYLEGNEMRDTHEWIHFREDERRANALLDSLGVVPKIYHFTNVKPFTAITIAVSDLTLEQVELELRRIFSICPLKLIEEPATRLMTELRIRGICGVAICDGRDAFNERRGRTIAKGRLAKHLRSLKRSTCTILNQMGTR